MPYSSERALILASVGRDAALAAAILSEAKIGALPCKTVPDLVTELRKGAGFAVVAEEAFRGADLLSLSAFLKRQPEWSDFQFILLTFRGGGLERNPAAARFLDVLGNVTFLERPFHPTTLVSLAQAALRGRRRQYEARKRLITIRESERHFRQVTESLPQLVWTCAANGSCDYLSPQWYLYTSRSKGEQLGYGWLEQLHPDDRERVIAQWQGTAAKGENFDLEFRIRRYDGAYRWFRTLAVPLRDEAGNIVKWFGSNIDIDENKQAEEKLATSEERLRAFMTATSDVVYRMNRDWSEMHALDGHGFLSSTLTPTRSWLDQYILADDQPFVLEAIAQSVRTKTILDLKHRVRRADGGIGWTHSRAVPLLNADGEIREWFGAATDITLQKQAEEALRRNAETFAALVEQSPLGIYTVDSQFRVRNVSAGAMPAFRNVQALIGRDFGEVMRILWPEPFASEAIRIFRHTLETGEPYVSQGLTEKRNDIGTSESYEWQVNRVTLADGQYGVVCYFFDTTRLQQAYQAVRESEERLRFSLQAASAGAWEWDILSGKSTWSPENYALFDVEPGADNPSYADWEARIHPEDREAANQQVRDVLEGREAEFRAEFRIVRRDGLVRWLAGFGKVERDADGAPLRMSGINIDITERKRDEEHIQLLMREVNHRSKNLLSLVQAIAHRTASTGAQDFIQRFGERIQSLAAAQDLLVRHAWKAVPLEDLVCSQLSHFADLIGTRIVIAGPALSITPAASQAIGMALHELATNAAKYGALSNERGRVDIAWTVSANGVAEPQLTMSWVEQGGPLVAKPQQRGFGSTVTSRMVEGSVGGEVSVDYARAGLVWRFSCPTENIVEGRLPSTVIEDSRPCPAGGGRRVLVVEDEPLIAAEIAATLELAGFKIIGPTGSVRHALALMAGDGCDAAVLDVNLGQETSEPIARGLMSGGKPFVVVSGYASAQLPQVFRAAPLIGKPLSPAMLEAEVRRLVTAAPRRLDS
jgi:PAS domain S-box-containing protein